MPSVAASLSASQLAASVNSSSAGGGGNTYVTQHQYALTPEDLMRVMEQGQRGEEAYGWIGQAHD